MDNQRIIAAGFVGGLVAAVLNSIPVLNFINCFCCAGIMLGGAVALIYYDRSYSVREYVNQATVVTVGITTGLFAAFISLGIEYLRTITLIAVARNHKERAFYDRKSGNFFSRNGS